MLVPDPASCKGMQVWVCLKNTSKGLGNGDHDRDGIVVTDSLSHQLPNRLGPDCPDPIWL